VTIETRSNAKKLCGTINTIYYSLHEDIRREVLKQVAINNAGNVAVCHSILRSVTQTQFIPSKQFVSATNSFLFLQFL